MLLFAGISKDKFTARWDASLIHLKLEFTILTWTSVGRSLLAATQAARDNAIRARTTIIKQKKLFTHGFLHNLDLTGHPRPDWIRFISRDK